MRKKLDIDHIISLVDPEPRNNVFSPWYRFSFSPQMSDSMALNELCNYFLGEDWKPNHKLPCPEQLPIDIVMSIEAQYKGCWVKKRCIFGFNISIRNKLDIHHLADISDVSDKYGVFPPLITEAAAVNELCHYFLGPDWNNSGCAKGNTVIVASIEKKYRGCKIKRKD